MLTACSSQKESRMREEREWPKRGPVCLYKLSASLFTSEVLLKTNLNELYLTVWLFKFWSAVKMRGDMRKWYNELWRKDAGDDALIHWKFNWETLKTFESKVCTRKDHRTVQLLIALKNVQWTFVHWLLFLTPRLGFQASSKEAIRLDSLLVESLRSAYSHHEPHTESAFY